MPYGHSGEIGDVWKHLPLCDVLKIELPKRYFETNSAFAEYRLEKNSNTEYGIFHLRANAPMIIQNSAYLRILSRHDFTKNNGYFGSPALAMTILQKEDTRFCFHDIEKEPLDDIRRFARKLNLPGRVFTCQGDSISAYLHTDYGLNRDDFIFIDPYQPFDCNKARETFFDLFELALKKHARTLLWYGYDNLKARKHIQKKLHVLSAMLPSTSIHTFDVWQKAMDEKFCPVNPGVPGCGLAVVNLKVESIQSIETYLKAVTEAYREVKFEGNFLSLDSEWLEIVSGSTSVIH